MPRTFPFRVLDMVVMGRTAHLGLFAAPSRGGSRARRSQALATLGIAELAETEYTRISGGQRQLALDRARACTGRARHRHGRADREPRFRQPGGGAGARCKRLAARGLAVVLSTHDPDHAFSVGNRVALLDDGRLIAQGLPAEVLTPERLHAVYGVASWWNGCRRANGLRAGLWRASPSAVGTMANASSSMARRQSALGRITISRSTDPAC